MFEEKEILDELRALRFCHSERSEESAFRSGQAPRGNLVFRRWVKKGNGPSPSFFSNAAGFSLVEVLVAMTILSIGILGITSLTGTSINAGAFAQNMTQATNIAQDRIEALQSIPYRNLHVTDNATARTDLRRTCAGPTGPANRPVYACTPSNAVTLGAKTFTWTYTVAFLDLNADGTADELSDGLKRIDVTVAWVDMLAHTNKTTTITTVVSK